MHPASSANVRTRETKQQKNEFPFRFFPVKLCRMNVDQVYQLQRDDAFAKQFSAKEYSTFVAMPFTNRNGYPTSRIKKLLGSVADHANGLLKAFPGGRERPRFAKLQTVNETVSGAIDITNEIPSQILNCHFFFGDLTGCNFGVVLEAGIALALKPDKRVILFTQDETASLHFDLKPTNVIRYTEPASTDRAEEDFVTKLANELVAAADAFEDEAQKYISLLSTQLTPDAISALKIYGELWKGWKRGSPAPAIWEDSATRGDPKRFACAIGNVAFHNAVRELSSRRLFWTQFVPNAGGGADPYGIHATNLGWRVIEHLWNHDPLMRKPDDAPTGPNLCVTKARHLRRCL